MILFEFNSRSSQRGVIAANQIAKRCGGVIIDSLYKIKFETPTDPELERLYGLVKNLKGTAMALENGEVIDPAKLFYAVKCERKIICRGICTHVSFGGLSVDQFIEKYSNYIEDNVLYIFSEKLLLSIAEFLEPVGDNKYKIKKSVFLEHFQAQADLEKRFCPNFNLFTITEEINKLPETLYFMDQDEFEKKFGETRREEILLREILANYRIDSTLSTEEILTCSKAISLLSDSPRGSLLQDIYIAIYSFPHINQYILLKIIEKEATLELANKEIPIFTKQNNLFYR